MSIFGQSHKAPDLPHDFPSLEKIGLGLVTVLDQLQIKTVVVMGEGAGANDVNLKKKKHIYVADLK